MVRPYDVHPEEIIASLRANGIPAGIVTRSPRWYAEALLEQFEVDVDVVVTGSDGHVPKPDPAALLAAAEELGIDPTEVAYVGDDVDDHHAAARAGMLSIGAIWAIEGGRAERWHRHWPDLAFRDPESLLDQTQWDAKRLAGEVALEGIP